MAKVAKKKNARVRRRERKNIEKGHAHIQSSFNNSIVTLSDVHGNVISWASADGDSWTRHDPKEKYEDDSIA